MYEPLLKLLSGEKQTRIMKFHFDVDKKLSIVSDLFVRYLACDSLNRKNSELVFATNSYGKPYIEGVQDFHYNISHTQSAIAIAVSRTPIGVDVEHICAFDSKIAERFFCQRETKYIESDCCNAEQRFYEIWTKKEAYVKWIGKGLSVPLNSFDVLDEELPCFFRTFTKGNYKISVCEGDGNYPDNCIDIQERTFYKKILSFMLFPFCICV